MRNAKNRLNGSKGFTLIELLVVVIILGVVAGIVFATDTPPSTQVNVAASEVYSAVVAARMEAIKAGRQAILRTVDRRILEVYIDENGSGAIDDGDREQTRVELPMRVRAVEDLAQVFFNNRGYVVSDSGAPTSFTLSLCATDPGDETVCTSGGYVTQVSVNVAGVPDIIYPTE